MYKIGITGSIGSGKTTIAKTFAFFNIPTFDADREIKEILKKKEIIQKLKSIWPLVVKKNHIDNVYFNGRLDGCFFESDLNTGNHGK